MNDSRSFRIDGVSLHSRYNPAIQAQRFLQNHCSAQVRTLIIVGAGLGYLADAASQLFPDAKILLVSAVHEELGETQNLRWSPRQQARASNAQSLAHFLHENLHYTDVSGLQIVYWPPGCRLLDTYCPEYLSIIRRSVTARQMELVTMGSLGRRFLSNTMHNSKAVSAAMLPPDRPVIVVAPGASLLPHLKALASCQEECCIIAVSSALQPLLENGIIPDLTAAIDAGFHAGRLLQPLSRYRLPHIPVLAYPQAHLPSWLDNPRIFMGDPQTLEGAFFYNSGRLGVSVPAAGTVTAAILQLLRKLKIPRALFVGLDLGSRNGRTHVQGHSSIRYQLQRNTRLAPFSHSDFLRSSHTSAALEQYYAWFTRNSSADGTTCYVAPGGSDAFPQESIGVYLSGHTHTSESRLPIPAAQEGIQDIQPLLAGVNDAALEAIDYFCTHSQLPHYPHAGTEVLIYTLLPLLNLGSRGCTRLRGEWNQVYIRLRDALHA